MKINTDKKLSLEPLGYWPTLHTLFHRGYRQSSLIVYMVAGTGCLDQHLAVEALSDLVAKHPLLRCKLVEESRRFLFDFEQPASPVFETYEVPVGSVQDKIDSLMEEGVQDGLWRFVLLHSGSRKGVSNWTLVLLCHHCISDGLSTALFFEDFFKFYSLRVNGVSAVYESLQPVPCLTELHSNALIDKTPTVKSLDNNWPIENFVPIEDRSPKFRRVALADDLLTRLLPICKRRQVSITSVLSAAILRASNIFSPVVLSAGVDLRRRVEPEVGREHFGCFSGMVQTSIVTDGDFWDLVKRCSEEQFAAIDKVLPSKYDKSVLKLMLDLRINNSLEQEVYSGGVAISNLGVLPNLQMVPGIEITDMYIAMIQTAALYGMFFVASSHNNILSLTMSYTEPLMSISTVDEISQNIIDELELCSR